VVTALGVLCVTNVLYAVAALRGTFRSGGVLDLGWDAGLLLLAAAAAVAPAAPPTAEAGARAISGNAARIAALVIGLAGIGTVAIRNALSAEPDAGSAGGGRGAAAVGGGGGGRYATRWGAVRGRGPTRGRRRRLVRPAPRRQREPEGAGRGARHSGAEPQRSPVPGVGTPVATPVNQ